MESFDTLNDEEKNELEMYANGYIQRMDNANLRTLIQKCLSALETSERNAIESSLSKKRIRYYLKNTLIHSYGDMVFYDNMDEALIGHAVQMNGRHVAVYDWDIMYDLYKNKNRGDIMDVMKMFLNEHKGIGSPIILFRQ